ncbi:MAG: oligosaccharide flippase family protein [Lachnospiraceae bacterium]|nr:oligosaccharide flippase family protein [Lachnospiraceae bacterium]
MSKGTERKNFVAAKAGIWYVVCNFFNKGVAFLTTPIFTRLLSKADIGEFSNYLVWLNLITLIVTMDMHVTIPRARFDYEGHLDEYASSIAVLSAVTTGTAWIVMAVFSKQVTGFMGISPEMLHVMMFTILFSGAFQTYQIRQRIEYKYKTFAVLSAALNVFSVLMSVVLILVFSDKLRGRLLGYTLPHVVLYFLLFAVLLNKGRCFKGSYSRYCLRICIPYIPHLLSLNILSASDRTMIKNICGPEDAALYSIGYSCAMVVTILATSLNQAWSPWLSEQLHAGNYRNTRKWSVPYTLLFISIVFMIGLLAPELVRIMGGKGYADSVNVIPPVMIGCVFQFIYTLYVNIETYEKKTVGMAFATMCGAGSNVILNLIFIPRYGYVAAAFTTVAGYAVLFGIHFFLVWRMGMAKVYRTRYIFLLLAFALGLIPLYYYLYRHFTQRIFLLALLLAAVSAAAFYHRALLGSYIKQLIRK